MEFKNDELVMVWDGIKAVIRRINHQTANKGGRMNLHGKIMNIQPDKFDANKAIAEAYKIFKTKSEVLYAVYRLGHRDARHAAAELAVGTKFRNCTMESAEDE